MAPFNWKHWITDTDYIELLNYIIERTKNVESPMSVPRLTREFKEKNGAAQKEKTLNDRIYRLRTKIHRFEHIDTNTKVRMMFALSAPVNAGFLKELKEDALVEVDDKQRITHYKSNDGSLELKGDHSSSAKNRTRQLESKQSIRSMIIDYFEKTKDTDAVVKKEEKSEMGNLIEIITEKCEIIDSPLNINRLVKDFVAHFEVSRSLRTIIRRIRGYCSEIQKAEFLDINTTVKQLFCLSATVDLDCLEKLRKDALVEVDQKNRIIKYISNGNSLILRGKHYGSKKGKPRHVKKQNKTVAAAMSDNSEEESDHDGLDDSSDEYSSEEFDSEFDSEDENNLLDETQDPMKPSNEANAFDNKTSARNRSPTEISIADNLDFDPPTERSHRSDETEIGEDQGNDREIMGITSVRTRYGRLSKRKHMDSALSNNQVVNSSSLGVSMNTDPASSKPAKQKKIAIEKEQASNSSSQSRCSSKSIKRSSRNSSFSTFSTESDENMEKQESPRAENDPSDYDSPRVQEVDDYDYNPREDNIPESSSIDNRLDKPELPSVDKQNTEPEPVEETLTPQNVTNSTPPTNAKEVIPQETLIKVEQEEPVENPTEDVKPKTTQNFKIKFFYAMRSLILSLDTPSLSGIQSKIHQKIRTIGTSGKMFSNDEMIPVLELLAARMTNHSVIDIPESVKTVSLIQFFCYLKASILNSEMSGMEGLLKNISKRIEESQNKKVPMEKVANALRATLDIDGF